jgi:ectoine hydroxylase-related dioxygenase (phytanoyl-CoA dioxygenase family)
MSVLTEEQIQHYYREGYVLAPGLVPAASVQAVLAGIPQDVKENGRWQPTIFDHEHPEKDAPIHRLLVEPRVVQAVSEIFSAPPRVFYGMLAIVPANGGNGLPWHQDNQYTQILGGALNVFIALSDVSVERAGLWVAPQSHRLGVQPSRKNETTAPGHREAVVAPENGIPLPPMQPGDACIFDRNTYHRSLHNETGEHRFAYAAQYQAEHAREALTGRKDPRRMLAADLWQCWAESGILVQAAR